METITRTDFPKRWYGIAQVCEITGLSDFVVREALLKGRIKGAFKAKPKGASPWRIPGEGAQEWFDVVRGLKRDDIEGLAKEGA